ncbi:hypothetical protein NI389_09100 [Pseudoalteromonas xiamenensis]|uniref:hypothetical protein n=1 Tax=Pseudoalteromonas xiamenensis TaxID=882626 RepID=UPI0027E57E10|nr:hypothetical protein [Pseudoalteromonas xiamenensis]WMN58428.1 hypothetical protein NI389_09100 [Pseudoalteromonas xiamenensis]
MAQKTLIRILHLVIVSGLLLIFTGHYLVTSDTLNHLGPLGFVIGASCIALGLIMSLPTKIYLTILLMRREKPSTQEKPSI